MTRRAEPARDIRTMDENGSPPPADKHFGEGRLPVSSTVEFRRREEDLAAQVRELARSNRELTQFAFIASHELQEPLRMVERFLGLVERRAGPELDGEAREFIGIAIDGATRMKRLIDDLLDYSRAGSRDLEYERVDLHRVIGDVLRTYERRIFEANATIEVVDLPAVYADPVMIERVFANLIDNALKYRSDRPPHVRVGAERVGCGWSITIADNGIGIEPRFQDQVFGMFRRLHARDKYSGTGIGLAVVKLAIERHGGMIAARQAPGGGTLFSFTLPDRPQPRERSVPGAA